jgi:hypothetical protein
MSLGKLIIMIALNGHFLTHIAQPMHKDSLIVHILLYLVTSMHNFSFLFAGQFFLHSNAQR